MQSAVTKAARISPTRGTALDVSAGILISVTDGVASIRATNTEVFYHEVVDTLSCEGSGEWRLGSAILGDFFSKLKIGDGKSVSMEDDGTAVVAKSGTTRAKFRMMASQYFPNWSAFSDDGLETVDNFKEILDRVKWAASREVSMAPLTGIHFDGEWAYATDRYRIVKTPCKLPLQNPITVPVTIFDVLIKSLGEIRIGVGDGHFLMMPDDYTQIKAVIYAGDYPKIANVKSDQPNSIAINKTSLIEMIDMSMVFAGFNRTPLIHMIIGVEEVAVRMAEGENVFLDYFEVSGQATHDRRFLKFTPRNLLDALDAAPNEQIHLYYDAENIASPVRIEGGSGYVSWVMPRREGSGDAS